MLSSMERDGADPVSVWLPNCATDNCISQGLMFPVKLCIIFF